MTGLAITWLSPFFQIKLYRFTRCENMTGSQNLKDLLWSAYSICIKFEDFNLPRLYLVPALGETSLEF